MQFGIDPEAPMFLIPFESFRSLGRIPSNEDHGLVGIESYDEIVERSNRGDCIVVFLSHQWLTPSVDARVAHPDYGGLKYSLVCEGLERLIAGLPRLERLLLWIDYCCIDQHDGHRRSAGLSNLPGYLERCDMLFTPYTYEIYEIRGVSAEVPKIAKDRFGSASEFALFSRYRSLFDYTERAWCRLEMFMGTNAPMPPDGYGYFGKLGVQTRADRPHLFYGPWHSEQTELPDPGPAISASFFRKLRPDEGFLTLEHDRSTIQRLVASTAVREVEHGYRGETNGAGQPHGRGIMRYESGAVYEGNWKDGKHDGDGTYVYANGMRYVGDWKQGQRSGEGVHYLSNGLVFKGSFLGGDSHGPGRLYYQNGKLKYEGTKKRTKWDGPLREYYPSGALRYEGGAKDNEWHDQGTEYAEDGSVIRCGTWEMGQYVGHGDA